MMISKVFEEYERLKRANNSSKAMNAFDDLRLHGTRKMWRWCLNVFEKIVAKHLHKLLRLYSSWWYTKRGVICLTSSHSVPPQHGSHTAIEKLPAESEQKKKKTMEVFFDSQESVHSKFNPEGLTVNKKNYLCILRRLRKSICCKRPEFWQIVDWYLLHDDVPAHRSQSVKQFLAKTRTYVLPHPPYSPDLVL
ncbi:hypothetical protein TNCV_3790981 [Trichonephila clavipes]|nr:hypothetical protein TNCV_3790981 [Trichonephila clavipes]